MQPVNNGRHAPDTGKACALFCFSTGCVEQVMQCVCRRGVGPDCRFAINAGISKTKCQNSS